MENLLQDIRYALRVLAKKPGFTIVALLTIAIGIGANTAIFSVLNAILLRPLPYADSERLVVLWDNFMVLDMVRIGAKPAELLDYQNENQVFDSVAGFNNVQFSLTGTGAAEHIIGSRVSPNLFSMLGAVPSLGRGFVGDDTQPGRDSIAILSHELWKRRFSSDEGVIGKSILLNGDSYNIVGVMPEGFQFPHQSFPFGERADIWMPLALNPEEVTTRGGFHNILVLAKLKPGVTVEQAQLNMDRVAQQLQEKYPNSYLGPGGADGGWKITVFSLHEEIVGKIRKSLLILLAAVGFVLLIVCVNIANLQLGRLTARQKEIAIRLAVGANRGRLVKQLVVESLVLAILGGMLGLVLAYWGISILVAMKPANVPRITEIGIDWRILLFTFGISILTGLIFGLAPSLQASKPQITETLREGGRTSNAGVGHPQIRNLFVVAQIAIALVLLIGAGLMIKGFNRLRSVDPGYKTERVLLADVSLRGPNYEEGRQRAAFYQKVLQQTQEIPGLQSAGLVSIPPLNRDSFQAPFSVEGRPFDPTGVPTLADFRVVSPGYFSTMNIPLIQGRDISEQDTEDAPGVAIISQMTAQSFFQNEDPIGKRIKMGAPMSRRPWLTIVGIVGTIRQDGLSIEPRSEIYMAYLQNPGRDLFSVMTVAMRSSTKDPTALTPYLRDAVGSVDKDVPLSNVTTMEEVLTNSISRERFNTLLMTMLAISALVLASVGIYGVMAFLVTQRTHEIGVRMALGANPRDIFKLVVVRSMLLVLLGLAIGVVAALALTQVMVSLLYGVTATDPMTILSAAVLLAVVAFLASFIPALRATRVDPLIALRNE
ncbi:MAG TPA: ABC transporter permease [Blastocatellia bacterium]|nr:ABC transporter permease [Blastocatellia bacterium]